MIIDSHVHVWVRDPEKYPWAPIGGYIPQSDAPVDELLSAMDSSGVDRAVLVQPTPYGWDHNYLLDAVQAHPERFRAVCLVDPFNSRVAEQMGLLVKSQGAAGFRLNWNLHPVQAWADDRNHRAFWATAESLDCPICIQCTLEYVPLLRTFCSHHADVPVVIDHIGRFQVSGDLSNPGFNELLSLHELPNVWIKISGFYYCSHQEPPYADLTPFIRKLLETFEPWRCLWGSDFPFIREQWGYAPLVEHLKETLLRSGDEREWVLGRTAQYLWWREGKGKH